MILESSRMCSRGLELAIKQSRRIAALSLAVVARHALVSFIFSVFVV